MSKYFSTGAQSISPGARVLARISKMPVLNTNFKISARPDLNTNLLQIPTTFEAYCVKKGNLLFCFVIEDGLFGKYLVITPQK